MDLDDDELKATRILNGVDTRKHRAYAIKFAVMQKQIDEKDKEIEKLQENVDYQVLCDFLINSVSDEEPIWTEKHIEELLENFEMRWKDAHK